MIDDYGWSEALEREFAPQAALGRFPGRVIVQQRGLFRLATDRGELVAEPAGRFRRQIDDYPVAGDWVAASMRDDGGVAIHAVLPRRTAFTRKAAGGAHAVQVVAANVDVALLVAALNADFNPRRLERYLAAAWQSGARPVVVLTKADLCADVPAAIAEAQSVVLDTPVLALSVVSGQGLDRLIALLPPRETAVLVGSSGAGKSTLVNALAQADRMTTQAIRETDGRGRHTTSHRELIRLPNGALLLDTPGMRELGLWEAEAAVAGLFEDVEAIERRCRFNNCSHQQEPGCAVRAALESGELDPGRWDNWRKLQGELAFQARRETPEARAAVRRKGVEAVKAVKAAKRRRGS